MQSIPCSNVDPIRDGKIRRETSKLQPKNKGVKRFNSYMLWCNEARPLLMEHYPYLDSASLSKKLGQIWATVPSLEKHNLKKCAKRLQLRTAKENNKLISHQLNEADLDLGRYEVTGTQPIDVAAHLALLGESLTLLGKSLKELEGQITVSSTLPLLLDSLLCALGPLLCLTQQIPEMNGADAELQTAKKNNELSRQLYEADLDWGRYNATGTQPIDVAAHLALLGDRLTLLGKKLKDNEDQTAVTGSVSIDFLLCALGSLLCLTQQIPEMNLSTTLKNEAYIMPGL